MNPQINTARLTIFPLSIDHLGDFLSAPEKLEDSLGYNISRKIVDENLRRAITIKLKRIIDLAPEDHFWLTYWLIKINKFSFGAGLIGFKGKPDQNGTVEIGYGIDPEVQNQGYMTEALQAMVTWGFDQADCSAITATRVMNPASNRILAKCGFELLAVNENGSNWIKCKKPVQETVFPSFHFQSIGMINTPFENTNGTPIQPTSAQDAAGVITIDPVYTEALKDLDGFSHIILIYVFDRTSTAKLTVKPFMDDNEHGLFATRAPARPNPIGISVVRLERLEGNKLFVCGVDMLDNTPLLDVKPYVPHFDPTEVERIGWLENNVNRLKNTRDDGRFLAKD